MKGQNVLSATRPTRIPYLLRRIHTDDNRVFLPYNNLVFYPDSDIMKGLRELRIRRDINACNRPLVTFLRVVCIRRTRFYRDDHARLERLVLVNVVRLVQI